MNILIPQSLLFGNQLPACLTHTWLQLRSLAGETGRCNRLSLEGLSRLTGKSCATLYRHLGRLQAAGLLDWSNPGGGLQISFVAAGSPPEAGTPDNPDANRHELPVGDSTTPAESGSNPPALTPSDPVESSHGRLANVLAAPGFSILSEDSQNCASASLNTLTDSLINLTRVERRRSKIKNGSKLRNLEKTPPENAVESRAAPAPQPAEAMADDPNALYRQLTRLTPNPAQRQLIQQQVHDLPRWRGTLEHWLAHHWNPRNLPGMLDLYRRGGASACRYCPGLETLKTSAPLVATAFQQLRDQYSARLGKTALAATGPAPAIPALAEQVARPVAMAEPGGEGAV